MRMRRKNKGFTLIEVVIAIAILAIALAPLTANFIASSKMNLKSRKNLNAMNLAQDIMEGMRGYPANEIQKKLAGGTVSGNILPATVIPGATSTDISTPGSTVKTYLIDNVQTATGNYNTYDVRITMKPTVSDNDMAGISSVDLSQDAMYTMSGYDEDKENAAINDLVDKSGMTEGDVRTKMRRSINLLLDTTGTLYTAKVSVVYTLDGIAESTCNYTVEHDISKTDGTKPFRSVYLYYTGLSNTSIANKRDTINITNHSESDTTVYLIRAKKKDQTSDITNYGCTVNIKAERKGVGDSYTDIDLYSSDSNGKVILVTNVRYDLLYGEEDNKRNIDEDGNVIAITGTSQYKRERADIYYNDLNNDGALDKVTEKFFKNSVQTGYYTDYPYTYVFNGYRRSDGNLLYSITLEILDKDDNSKVLATYQGGTIN